MGAKTAPLSRLLRARHPRFHYHSLHQPHSARSHHQHPPHRHHYHHHHLSDLAAWRLKHKRFFAPRRATTVAAALWWPVSAPAPTDSSPVPAFTLLQVQGPHHSQEALLTEAKREAIAAAPLQTASVGTDIESTADLWQQQLLPLAVVQPWTVWSILLTVTQLQHELAATGSVAVETMAALMREHAAFYQEVVPYAQLELNAEGLAALLCLLPADKWRHLALSAAAKLQRWGLTAPAPVAPRTAVPADATTTTTASASAAATAAVAVPESAATANTHKATTTTTTATTNAHTTANTTAGGMAVTAAAPYEVTLRTTSNSWIYRLHFSHGIEQCPERSALLRIVRDELHSLLPESHALFSGPLLTPVSLDFVQWCYQHKLHFIVSLPPVETAPLGKRKEGEGEADALSEVDNASSLWPPSWLEGMATALSLVQERLTSHQVAPDSLLGRRALRRWRHPLGLVMVLPLEGAEQGVERSACGCSQGSGVGADSGAEADVGGDSGSAAVSKSGIAATQWRVVPAETQQELAEQATTTITDNAAVAACAAPREEYMPTVSTKAQPVTVTTKAKTATITAKGHTSTATVGTTTTITTPHALYVLVLDMPAAVKAAYLDLPTVIVVHRVPRAVGLRLQQLSLWQQLQYGHKLLKAAVTQPHVLQVQATTYTLPQLSHFSAAQRQVWQQVVVETFVSSKQPQQKLYVQVQGVIPLLQAGLTPELQEQSEPHMQRWPHPRMHATHKGKNTKAHHAVPHQLLPQVTHDTNALHATHTTDTVHYQHVAHVPSRPQQGRALLKNEPTLNEQTLLSVVPLRTQLLWQQLALEIMKQQRAHLAARLNLPQVTSVKAWQSLFASYSEERKLQLAQESYLAAVAACGERESLSAQLRAAHERKQDLQAAPAAAAQKAQVAPSRVYPLALITPALSAPAPEQLFADNSALQATRVVVAPEYPLALPSPQSLAAKAALAAAPVAHDLQHDRYEEQDKSAATATAKAIKPSSAATTASEDAYLAATQEDLLFIESLDSLRAAFVAMPALTATAFFRIWPQAATTALSVKLAAVLGSEQSIGEMWTHHEPWLLSRLPSFPAFADEPQQKVTDVSMGLDCFYRSVLQVHVPQETPLNQYLRAREAQRRQRSVQSCAKRLLRRFTGLRYTQSFTDLRDYLYNFPLYGEQMPLSTAVELSIRGLWPRLPQPFTVWAQSRSRYRHVHPPRSSFAQSFMPALSVGAQQLLPELMPLCSALPPELAVELYAPKELISLHASDSWQHLLVIATIPWLSLHMDLVDSQFGLGVHLHSFRAHTWVMGMQKYTVLPFMESSWMEITALTDDKSIPPEVSSSSAQYEPTRDPLLLTSFAPAADTALTGSVSGSEVLGPQDHPQSVQDSRSPSSQLEAATVQGQVQVQSSVSKSELRSSASLDRYQAAEDALHATVAEAKRLAAQFRAEQNSAAMQDVIADILGCSPENLETELAATATELAAERERLQVLAPAAPCSGQATDLVTGETYAIDSAAVASGQPVFASMLGLSALAIKEPFADSGALVPDAAYQELLQKNMALLELRSAAAQKEQGRALENTAACTSVSQPADITPTTPSIAMASPMVATNLAQSRVRCVPAFAAPSLPPAESMELSYVTAVSGARSLALRVSELKLPLPHEVASLALEQALKAEHVTPMALPADYHDLVVPAPVAESEKEAVVAQITAAADLYAGRFSTTATSLTTADLAIAHPLAAAEKAVIMSLLLPPVRFEISAQIAHLVLSFGYSGEYQSPEQRWQDMLQSDMVLRGKDAVMALSLVVGSEQQYAGWNRAYDDAAISYQHAALSASWGTQTLPQEMLLPPAARGEQMWSQEMTAHHKWFAESCVQWISALLTHDNGDVSPLEQQALLWLSDKGELQKLLAAPATNNNTSTTSTQAATPAIAAVQPFSALPYTESALRVESERQEQSELNAANELAAEHTPLWYEQLPRGWYEHYVQEKMQAAQWARLAAEAAWSQEQGEQLYEQALQGYTLREQHVQLYSLPQRLKEFLDGTTHWEYAPIGAELESKEHDLAHGKERRREQTLTEGVFPMCEQS